MNWKFGIIIALIILLSSCSVAGVNNKYKKSGPVFKQESESSFKNTTITIKNEPTEDDLILGKTKKDPSSTLIIKKVGETDYIVIIKERGLDDD